MCIDCQFHSSYLDDNLNSVRICTKGNQSALENWWKENGNKVRGEWDRLDCFEEEEISKFIGDLVKDTDNLLEEIKNV